MPGSPEISDHEIQRVVLRLVGAVIAVVLAAGVTLALSRSEGGDEAGAGRLAPVPEVVAIGPANRVEVPAYVEDRAAVLDGLDGGRAAVVSFDRYLTEAEARARLQPEALLVAGAGGDPAVVTGPLEEWAAEERAYAASEVENLTRLLETTGEAEFVATYREDIARYRHLAETLDPAGPIVFGAVVVAGADELRRLAKVDGVRLVDVGPTDEVPDASGLRGLRPEEREWTGSPPYRPLS